MSNRFLKSALLVAVAYLPQGALAQTVDEADVSSGSIDFDEIVVTAQKREQRLIDTPQSVTAITSDDLANLNATQFRDFANTVPALSFTTAGVGQTQVTLRGVTAGIDIGPTVGIYVNDTPYGSSSAFSNASSLALDVGLFDLDRVEVLRGPQGTLYGAGAMGGVIKYVTKQPNLTELGGLAQGGISVTKSGGANYHGAAALNAPLVADELAVRVSGFYSGDAGYIDNLALGDSDVDRSHVYGGRLDLLFKPSDELSIRLTGFVQDIDREGAPAADFTLAGEPVDGALNQRRLKSEPFEQQFRLLSGTIDYDFGPVVLTSNTSYQKVDVAFRQDASAVYVPLLGFFGLPFSAVAVDQGRSTDKFAQEIRLASRNGSAFEWLVGGYYTDEKSGNSQLVVPYDLSGAVSPINLATVFIPSRYEEVAIFGNATLHLGPKFEIGGGLRYASNNQEFMQNGSGLLIGSVPASKSSDDVVTYLANASYHFSPDVITYLRFATGYRPGGPNFVVNDPITGAPLASPTFKSDSLKSYELGFKGQTGDRTFAVDASVYHIDWENIQVTTAAGGVSVIANASGGAKIDGGELTLTARPSPNFTVVGGFAYQDARLRENETLLGAAKGERLPNVPKFTAAISADYRMSNGGNLRPTAGATLRFVSDRTASFDANPSLPQYQLPDYVTVDLRAGLAFGSIELQVFARNLFDDRGQLSAATFLSVIGGPAQVTMLQPRTIGISASARF